MTNVSNSTAQLGASAIKEHTLLTPRRYCDGFVQIVAHPRTSWQEDLDSWQEDLARLPYTLCTYWMCLRINSISTFKVFVFPCALHRRPHGFFKQIQHHGDDGCSINLELQEDHGDIGSHQIIYKRLLWYEFKNTASSSGDLRDYEELSDVTLVCEEK